ncbi:unnamed protein product [Anisakis simplex]|uniref:Type I site-specific deoxyribonuclease n=1 Tax=Anisakis simplex TaxID=6269 RepID=A0A0M3J637_ANISI|nr:unnamed protein product [Anisakis simplex]
MAPDNLKDLLLGNQTDAEFEQNIVEFERLAAYIETENADVDVETKPAELPGQMQKIRNDQVRVCGVDDFLTVSAIRARIMLVSLT